MSVWRYLLVGPFGLAGATMAFFGLYVWHGLLIYVIVRRLTGFRWSAANRRNGLLFLPLIGAVFCGFLRASRLGGDRRSGAWPRC